MPVTLGVLSIYLSKTVSVTYEEDDGRYSSNILKLTSRLSNRSGVFANLARISIYTDIFYGGCE